MISGASQLANLNFIGDASAICRFNFLAGDLDGLFRCFLIRIVCSAYTRSNELSEPLVLPPLVVESSAADEIAPVRVVLISFMLNFGGLYDAEVDELPPLVGFLLLSGYSSRWSSLIYEPIIIISTLLLEPGCFFSSCLSVVRTLKIASLNPGGLYLKWELAGGEAPMLVELRVMRLLLLEVFFLMLSDLTLPFEFFCKIETFIDPGFNAIGQ